MSSGPIGSTGVESGSLKNVLIELESRGTTVSGRVTSPSGSAGSGGPVLAAPKLVAVGLVRTGPGTVSGGLARPTDQGLANAARPTAAVGTRRWAFLPAR